jgi:hypothetical protein
MMRVVIFYCFAMISLRDFDDHSADSRWEYHHNGYRCILDSHGITYVVPANMSLDLELLRKSASSIPLENCSPQRDEEGNIFYYYAEIHIQTTPPIIVKIYYFDSSSTDQSVVSRHINDIMKEIIRQETPEPFTIMMGMALPK